MTSPFSHPIRALILDMDGVLWRDHQALLDLPAFFAGVAAKGVRVVFATNNATRSVPMYVERLADFGIAAAPWQVVTSAVATADYLAERFPSGGALYVVGETGLQQEISARGFSVLDDHTPIEEDAQALAVVAGMDHFINYDKLARAALLIRAGVPFIGTNPDRSFPSPRGLVPGAGAILALLTAATDVTPTLIGKPGPALYQVAMQRLGEDPAHTLAVGDRLETDILGGQRANCPTALVLSGVSTAAEAAAWQPPPDLVLPDLSHLLDYL